MVSNIINTICKHRVKENLVIPLVGTLPFFILSPRVQMIFFSSSLSLTLSFVTNFPFLSPSQMIVDVLGDILVADKTHWQASCMVLVNAFAKSSKADVSFNNKQNQLGKQLRQIETKQQ